MRRASVVWVLSFVAVLAACGGDAFQSSQTPGSAGAGGAGGGTSSCADPQNIALPGACISCLQASCCGKLTACDGDPACTQCLTSNGACSSDAYPPLYDCASTSCGSVCGLSNTSGKVVEACKTFATFGKLDSGDCTSCINDVCNAGQIVSVCGSNPADTCNGQCGSNNDCFCNCMASQTGACGVTIANAYPCFTSKCASPCNAH